MIIIFENDSITFRKEYEKKSSALKGTKTDSIFSKLLNDAEKDKDSNYKYSDSGMEPNYHSVKWFLKVIKAVGIIPENFQDSGNGKIPSILTLILIDLTSTSNEDLFEDEELIQGAIDHWLGLKSYTWTDFLIKTLVSLKIEPVLGIRSLSEIIQNCEGNNSFLFEI